MYYFIVPRTCFIKKRSPRTLSSNMFENTSKWNQYFWFRKRIFTWNPWKWFSPRSQRFYDSKLSRISISIGRVDKFKTWDVWSIRKYLDRKSPISLYRSVCVNFFCSDLYYVIRIHSYSVVSMSSSVLYFGGRYRKQGKVLTEKFFD